MTLFSLLTIALLGVVPQLTSAAALPTDDFSLTLTARGTPSPLQPGTVHDCDSYHKVKSGDTCAKLAKAAHVSLKDFYSWNKGLHKDCGNLMSGYYVCTVEGSKKHSAPHPKPAGGKKRDVEAADAVDTA